MAFFKTDFPIVDPEPSAFYDRPIVEPMASAGSQPTSPGFPITRAVLSPDQHAVYDAIKAWLDGREDGHLTFGGLAGTGKTTLLSVLASEEKKKAIAFAAYTGKAASVLGRKLGAAGVHPSYCGTIHGLIYRPVSHEHIGPNAVACDLGKKCERLGKVEGWRKAPALPYDLIILDEASMVGADIWQDLLAYGLPILAVGDHGQLPPIGSSTTNLLSDPILKLEKIHRQAAGNPILALAHHVRAGGSIGDFRSNDDRVRFVKRGVGSAETAKIVSGLDGAAICYYNRTRTGINTYVRQQLANADRTFGKGPVVGDIVICLKNAKPIWNGMRGICTKVEPVTDRYGKFFMAVDFPDEKLRLRGYCNLHQFGRDKTFDSIAAVPGEPERWSDVGMLFDFGYALTGHKSQGSQWPDVVLIVEGRFDDDEGDMQRRWEYTTITRASERLHIVL